MPMQSLHNMLAIVSGDLFHRIAKTATVPTGGIPPSVCSLHLCLNYDAWHRKQKTAFNIHLHWYKKPTMMRTSFASCCPINSDRWPKCHPIFLYGFPPTCPRHVPLPWCMSGLTVQWSPRLSLFVAVLNEEGSFVGWGCTIECSLSHAGLQEGC